MIANYIEVFTKCLDFQSRARRREYWLFFLANLIIVFLLGFFLGLTTPEATANIIIWLYQLAVLLPGIAVGVRRLHDIGRSGLWLLIAFAPLAGVIVLLVWFVQESEPHTNDYGTCPK
ncbi:MAG: DUF805 domain-containing protein [Planctomycetaceae bacterium]|jgi:uncharacterized membrane protein YhaH (DUF805 family)|nr:DUF805 domain-containing protein [Planctomycetaceae bacterium]